MKLYKVTYYGGEIGEYGRCFDGRKDILLWGGSVYLSSGFT